MNRRLQAVLFLAVAVLAGATGFYFNRVSLDSRAARDAAERLMLASFADPGGKRRQLSEWRGKVLVVNFWATWCAPCREEIPGLIRVQEKYASNGVQIVGIALDSASKVREFSDEMRIGYPLLIAGIDAIDLSKDLGNNAGVLPYTIVLDRAGRVTYAHRGAVTEAELGAAVAGML